MCVLLCLRISSYSTWPWSDRRISRPISFVACCARTEPLTRANTWYSWCDILVPLARGTTFGHSEDFRLWIVRWRGLKCQLHAGLCVTPFHFTLGLLQHRGLGRDRMTKGAHKGANSVIMSMPSDQSETTCLALVNSQNTRGPTQTYREGCSCDK